MNFKNWFYDSYNKKYSNVEFKNINDICYINDYTLINNKVIHKRLIDVNDSSSNNIDIHEMDNEGYIHIFTHIINITDNDIITIKNNCKKI
jgi:hypothetical protein